jgi:hypothetical protein
MPSGQPPAAPNALSAFVCVHLRSNILAFGANRAGPPPPERAPTQNPRSNPCNPSAKQSPRRGPSSAPGSVPSKADPPPPAAPAGRPRRPPRHAPSENASCPQQRLATREPRAAHPAAAGDSSSSPAPCGPRHPAAPAPHRHAPTVKRMLPAATPCNPRTARGAPPRRPATGAARQRPVDRASQARSAIPPTVRTTNS